MTGVSLTAANSVNRLFIVNGKQTENFFYWTGVANVSPKSGLNLASGARVCTYFLSEGAASLSDFGCALSALGG
jgi:hypothetical protein